MEIKTIREIRMDYGKIFEEIAKKCNDERTYIINGILQSIRDNRLIDKTTLEQMLFLVYNQTKRCTEKTTLNSTKIDSKKDLKCEIHLN